MEFLKRNGFLVYHEKTDEIKLCSWFEITGIVENLETGKLFFELSFECHGRLKKINLPRAKLTAKGLQEFAGEGLDFLDNSNNKLICKYILSQENNVDYTVTYSSLGWHDFNGDLIYLAGSCLSKIDAADKFKFSKSYDYGCVGSYKQWLRMFKKLISGHTCLESIVSASLSAILIAYLNHDTLFFHIYSDSSYGKTTATELAASLYGKPEISDTGIIQQFNATESGFLKELKGNHGVCAFWDELSASSFHDFTRLVYSVRGGKDKVRYNTDFDPSSTWRTAIISNGETSILSRTNKNTGVAIRVLEFEDVQWTVDANQAEAISLWLKSSYGHFAKEFVSVLQQLEKRDVEEEYAEALATIRARLDSKNRLHNRLAKCLADIYLTAMIANELCGLPIDPESILSFLLTSKTLSNVEQSLSERALDAFKADFTANRSKYLVESSGITEPIYQSGIYGKLIYKGDELTTIAVIYEKFAGIMARAGFESVDLVVQALNKEKFTICEPTRAYKRIQFNKIRTKCVVFDAAKLMADDGDEV